MKTRGHIAQEYSFCQTVYRFFSSSAQMFVNIVPPTVLCCQLPSKCVYAMTHYNMHFRPPVVGRFVWSSILSACSWFVCTVSIRMAGPSVGETRIKYAPFFRLPIFAGEWSLYEAHSHTKQFTTVSILSPVPTMFALLVIAVSFVLITRYMSTCCDEWTPSSIVCRRMRFMYFLAWCFDGAGFECLFRNFSKQNSNSRIRSLEKVLISFGFEIHCNWHFSKIPKLMLSYIWKRNVRRFAIAMTTVGFEEVRVALPKHFGTHNLLSFESVIIFHHANRSRCQMFWHHKPSKNSFRSSVILLWRRNKFIRIKSHAVEGTLDSKS